MKSFLRQCIWNLRLAFRARDGVFWVIFYPMLLLLFMNLAFSKLQTQGMPELRLAVVPGMKESLYLQQIKELTLTETSETEGRSLVETGKADALLLENGDLYVQKEGISQNILQSIVTEIRQTYKLGFRALSAQQGRGQILKSSGFDFHPIKIVYLNVFATFCLYGYFYAIFNFSLLRANQGPVSLRQTMAGSHRNQLFFSALFCSAIMAVLGQACLILFSEKILKLGVLTDYPRSLAIIGSGILLGIAIGAVMGILRLPDWFRLLFMIVGSLVMGFLSGLMSSAIRGIIALHAPWLLKINPVAHACDGLLRVNLLGESGAVLPTVLPLLLASILLFATAYLIQRRQRFQSL